MLRTPVDRERLGTHAAENLPAPVADAQAAAVEIGRGAQGVVYRLPSGHIKKKYFDSVPDHMLEREFEHSRAAFAGGVPTWRAERLVRKERTIVGSFEPGTRLARVIRRRPLKAAALMRSLGKLHAQVHAIRTPTEASWYIYDSVRSAAILAPFLSEQTIRRIGKLVSMSEEGFCHADLSLTNVLCDKETLTLLDWARSGQGPMTADVGRTCAFILARPPRFRLLILFNRWFCRRLALAYVSAYSAETGRPAEEIWAWTTVFLARKIARALPSAHKLLIGREITYIEKTLLSAPMQAAQ